MGQKLNPGIELPQTSQQGPFRASASPRRGRCGPSTAPEARVRVEALGLFVIGFGHECASGEHPGARLRILQGVGDEVSSRSARVSFGRRASMGDSAAVLVQASVRSSSVRPNEWRDQRALLHEHEMSDWTPHCVLRQHAGGRGSCVGCVAILTGGRRGRPPVPSAGAPRRRSSRPARSTV